MPAKIDLTNKHFGEWTVIREATKEEKHNKSGAFWLCKCSCGKEKIVSGQCLRNNESKSCGCKTIDFIKKGNENKAEDLTNKNFGRLLVLYRDFQYEKQYINRGQTYWYCQCDCGNFKTVGRNDLLSKKTQSCGCLRREISAQNISEISKNNFIDETGNRYGKLTVLYKIENKTKRDGVIWHCKCDCGNEKDIFGIDLRSGNVASCGCLGKSQGEWEIEQILNNNDISFVKEYPISIENKKLRFDFAIFQNNELSYFIEFDGIQHFQSVKHFGGEDYLNEIQFNDNLKNQWCKNHNIPLIRIPYDKKQNIQIEDLQIATSNYLL